MLLLLSLLTLQADNLSEQIARIERKSIDVAEQLKDTDPEKSRRLLRGVKLLRERAAAYHAELARDQEKKGNPENALKHRASVMETLKRLLAILEGKEPSDDPRRTPEEERLEEILAVLKRLLQEQTALNKATTEFDAARPAAITREHRMRITELADEQKRIAREIEELDGHLDGEPPAFRYVLKRAGEDAADAGGRLDKYTTDAPLRELQVAVARRLKQLIGAFEERLRTIRERDGEPGPPGGDGRPGPRIPDAVELQLILAMQEELYARTQAAHRALPAEGSELTVAQKALLRRLTDEQGMLAKLLQGVIDRASER
jgi:hypothetical protein